MNNLLVFENVWKIYSEGTSLEVAALRDINLEIEKGSFTYVLGPSGSGKTTLLNIAGLLDAPSKGRILFAGRVIHSDDGRERARLRNSSIGFVFQQPSFLPEFTALENVVLPALIGGRTESAVVPEVRKMFQEMGMEKRMEHFPGQLSGGELQRLTILRALVNKPEIILCDEPTGQLDEKNAGIVLGAMEEIFKRFGATVLFVTHNEELTKIGKKVINLRNGRIV
ncbi:MAG: ABC transporter ATP-binding protein [bacterium]